LHQSADQAGNMQMLPPAQSVNTLGVPYFVRRRLCLRMTNAVPVTVSSQSTEESWPIHTFGRRPFRPCHLSPPSSPVWSTWGSCLPCPHRPAGRAVSAALLLRVVCRLEITLGGLEIGKRAKLVLPVGRAAPVAQVFAFCCVLKQKGKGE